jgi:cell wall-associated NlpC family hydrolase
MRRFRTLLIALALLPLPAHADEAGNPPDFNPPAAQAAASGVLGQAQEFALRALSFIGVRYKWGGTSPDTGFDCSGLIRYVYAQVTGHSLPYNAQDLSHLGASIDRSELQPGDLVFFNTLRRPFSHVGIYLGESRFVHAPSRGGAVEIVDMGQRYWKNRYNGARRLPI